MTKRLSEKIVSLLESEIFELKEEIESDLFWDNIISWSKNKRKLKEAELNLKEFKTLIDEK